jgi:PIN domain nuclease of toxin-antitoxin system
VRLLLDTSTFLFASLEPHRLSLRARSALSDPDNQLWLSAASAWEITIKHGHHRLDLPELPRVFVPRMRVLHNVETLDVAEAVATIVGELTGIHRDPFDRLLVAQAQLHDMTLVTPDEVLHRYPVRWLW